jgi:hypothetical protein
VSPQLTSTKHQHAVVALHAAVGCAGSYALLGSRARVTIMHASILHSTSLRHTFLLFSLCTA